MRKLTIRQFIITWMCGLVLCFILMATFLIVCTNKLQSMSTRIVIDSQAIDTANHLEIAILGERREDLLWRATNDENHLNERTKELEEIQRIVQQLHINTTTQDESRIIETIERIFDQFYNASLSQTLVPIERMSRISNNLLEAVEDLKEQNRMQMSETLAQSSKLNTIVDRCSILLIFFVACIILSGSYALIQRIVQPTSSLIHAALRFGNGVFNFRAQVHRNDELGMLSKTFNDMADNIVSLQQERMSFIASVVHDLKNPLVFIGIAAKRLRKRIDIQDREHIWLDYIIEQTGHLENTINDFMDIVRIENGNFNLHISDIELTSFVQEIHHQLNELIATHTLLFQGKHECWIKGDKKRLERVIFNLISNSVKYSPPHTTILLSVEKKVNHALKTVKDEGAGIQDEEIPKLFKPFQRLKCTQNMAKGNGLGLFSAKKIVDGHGGMIEISSEPGNGTIVNITLPLIT